MPEPSAIQRLNLKQLFQGEVPSSMIHLAGTHRLQQLVFPFNTTVPIPYEEVSTFVARSFTTSLFARHLCLTLHLVQDEILEEIEPSVVRETDRLLKGASAL